MNYTNLSTPLAGKNVLILGSGAITRELAKTLVVNQAKVKVVTNLEQESTHSSHSEFVTIVSRKEFLLRAVTDEVDVAIIAVRPERWNTMESISLIFGRIRELAPGQVILLSSSSIYGDSLDPFIETSKPKPTSEYGKIRLSLEVELINHFELNKITVLRISNVFGHPNLGGLIELIAQIIQNPIRVETEIDFEAVRDYISLGDLIHGIILSMDRKISGFFNLSSGVGTTVQDIFSSLPKALLSTTPLKSTHLPDIARCVILHNSKFGEACNWYPNNPLHQIVNYLINPYIDRDLTMFS